MELKVCVDGVQRVVCGVTDSTTCQEVVIALAQALGQTGRYTLKEKFKDYERNVTPSERLLESLGKYGQQSRDVQLTLQHNGPPLRGGNTQRRVTQRRSPDSGASSLTAGRRRQSLPPLYPLRLNTEGAQVAEDKKPKRKSVTLVEEARGWLESLSWSGRSPWGREKAKDKEARRKEGSPSKMGRQEVEQRMSCLLEKVDDDLHGTERAVDQNKNLKSQCNTLTKGVTKNPLDPPTLTETNADKLITQLRALLMFQQAQLRNLRGKIDATDIEIKLQEENVKTYEVQEDQRWKETEETEQLQFWENELRAEEGHEMDLQKQFQEMKVKAGECKAKLEEYKHRLDLVSGPRITAGGTYLENISLGENGSEVAQTKRETENQKADLSLRSSSESGRTDQAEPLSCTKPGLETSAKALHRTELTIILTSTRV